MKQRTALIAMVAGAAIVTLALGGGAAADSTVTVDDNHDLATQDGVLDFQQDGYATTELTQLNMTVSVAREKTDVGMGAGLTPLDVKNDYLRLQYNEGVERTVRIFIPSKMTTPYTRENVESLNSPHVADFEPVRGGDYLAVTIRFSGPADVVLPLDQSASASYDILARAESRVERVTGLSLSGDKEWTYVDAEELDGHTVVEIEANPETAEIQYDASGSADEELWASMPQGDTRGVKVYWYYSSEDDRIYVVPKGEDPPTIRYKKNATTSDEVSGAVGDARSNLQELGDLLSDLPFQDDTEGGN